MQGKSFHVNKTTALFIFGNAVTIFGTGFVFPLTALYLDDVLNASSFEISAYFFLAAAAAFLATPIAGVLSDRHGPRPVGAMGIILQTTGTLVIATASNGLLALGGGLVLGLGNGCFFGVQTPIFVDLFGKERLPKILGIQYIVMNVAVAAAGTLGGFVASTYGAVGYRVCFAYNAISFLIYGEVLFLAIPKRKDRGACQIKQDQDVSDGERGIVAGIKAIVRPLSDSLFVRLAILQLLLAGFGFAQMDAVMPLMFVNNGGFDVAVSGIFLTVNGITVVLLQNRMVNLVEKIGKVKGLLLTIAFWLTGTCVAFIGVSSFAGNNVGLALIMIYAVVFGVGETFLTPSLQPMVVEVAPDNRLGSYSAVVETMYSMGSMIGPALTLWTVDRNNGAGVWLIISAALILAAFLVIGQSGRMGKAHGSAA